MLLVGVFAVVSMVAVAMPGVMFMLVKSMESTMILSTLNISALP